MTDRPTPGIDDIWGTALNSWLDEQFALKANDAAVVHVIGAETIAQARVVNLTGDLAAKVDLASAQTIPGGKWFTSNENRFGTGAAGAAGAYVRVGDFGDAGKIELIVAGTSANIDFAARTKGTGTHRFKNGAGTDLVTLDSSGNIAAKGSSHNFGTGAFGAAGAFLQMGDLGGAANVYILAQGSAANVELVFRAKGSSPMSFQTPAGTVLLDIISPPAAGDTSVKIHHGGVGMKLVTVGAVDSGGAGFRLLRIAN